VEVFPVPAIDDRDHFRRSSQRPKQELAVGAERFRDQLHHGARAEAMPILIDIADALAGLQGNVIHRDLKPRTSCSTRGHWSLADFGISRYAEATTAPDTHKYAMTPPYVAQRTTPATDVYAFGVVTFEMLAGRRPFPGPALEDFREQHLNQDPPPLTNVAPSLAALASESLFKAPQARPTAANVAARLRLSLQQPSPSALRLQNANKKVIAAQSAASAQASAHASLEEQRSDLFAAATQSFQVLVDRLLTAVLEAASAAQIHRSGKDIIVRLGNGVLMIDGPQRTPSGALQAYGRPGPFHVVAHSAIRVKQPRDPYEYEGRSHALWFCDAYETGVYGWFETAFMVTPTIAQRFTFDPFALDPTNKDAGGAFSNVMTVRQLALVPRRTLPAPPHSQSPGRVP
jgi:eukaryotic-like serine/threonine-protein kinase